MTNPYQTPHEVDWQDSPRVKRGPDSKKQFLLALTVMTVSVSLSGAFLGSLVGLVLGPDGVAIGALVGFCVAILPSAVSSLFCLLSVSAMFPNNRLSRNNTISGLASGALAGFISVMASASGSLSQGSFRLAIVAVVFGSGGGLCGAFIVNRRLLKK